MKPVAWQTSLADNRQAVEHIFESPKKKPTSLKKLRKLANIERAAWEARRDHWERKERRREEARRHKRSDFSIVLAALGFVNYTEYLASELWASVRGIVLASNPPCVRCGEPAWQVHHSRYDLKTMTGKSKEHLHPVCGDCHHAAHASGPAIADANRFLGVSRNTRSRNSPR